MLRGLALINIYADDLDAAKRWYAELLGIDAYFERPGYCEFRLGDYGYELGIIDRRYAPAAGGGGAGGKMVCWGCGALAYVLARARSRWAGGHSAPSAWGGGRLGAGGA